MNPIQRFFQEDIPATFSAGKWRLNLLQLNTRFGQLDKQKGVLLGELGVKTWNSKIRHEGYAGLYGKLEELDKLVAQVQQEIDSLHNKINQETEHLKATNADFDTRLKDAQAQRQAASQKLSELQTVQRNIQQRLAQLQSNITQGNSNLQAFQSQIIQLQASDQVDKEARIASLHSTSATVQAQINDANLQISKSKADLTANQEQQIPVKNEMDGLSQNIIRLQEQNKAAVTPIQQQLKLFQQDLLKVNEKKNGLLSQISTKMTEFGGHVYKFHPAAEALSAEYARLDANQAETKTVNDQINLTQAHLSTVNSGSLTKVALAVGGLVFLIASILVLVFWVIPKVSELMKPDPKASISLVQNWTLENCGLSGPANGVYLDVSVWENRRTDAVANVEAGSRLLGANKVVLDTNSDSLQIAPGGQAASILTLQANGSRVQELDRAVSSVSFSKTNPIRVDNLVVKPQFAKSKTSNNNVISLEITNKTDFGLMLSGNSPVYAFVVNKQNKLIDILTGGLRSGSLATDAMSSIDFFSIAATSQSCLQKDYSKEEVTFWYFVPMQVSNSESNQFTISGKAVYTP